MTAKLICLSCQDKNLPNARFCANCYSPVKLNPDEAIDNIAMRAFRMAGYCAPDAPIPKEIFKLALGVVDKGSQKDGSIDQMMWRLNSLHVADLVQDGLCFDHEAVVIARRRDEIEGERALFVLAFALADLAFLAALNSNSYHCLLYRPHLLVVAEWAEQARLERAVSLWSCLGTCQFMSQDFKEAVVSHGRGISMSLKIFGMMHATTGICMCNRAKALRAVGEFEESKCWYEAGINILDEIPGSDSDILIHKASGLADYGSLLHQLGQLVEAREILKMAISTCELADVNERHALYAAVYNLGTVLRDLGDDNGARIQFERARRIGK